MQKLRTISILVDTTNENMSAVEETFRRRLSQTLNVSEHMIIARCSATDYETKRDLQVDWAQGSGRLWEAWQPFADRLSETLLLNDSHVERVEHVGESYCVTDASPPPQSPYPG